jgi:tetratricopeptide (TPR) repeat protein
VAAPFISLLLLEQARLFAQHHDWRRARQAASQALELNPALVDAYLIRGFCGRKLGDFHEALAEYTRAIELDSQQGRAWLDRGAVKVLIAYSIDDPQQAAAGPPYRKYCPEAVQWLLEAHVDYDKGARLDPDDDSAGLSLLELEIILDRHKEAVARAAEWWNRVQEPGKRMACAWLGAVAFILAGKKERHWAQFREHLERNSTPPAWEPEQIDGYLARVQKERKCPSASLADTQRVHALFLSRYRSPKEASP